jgi:hypothetical protein
MARFESDGWLREWYDMTKARTVTALKRAMAPLAMNFGNVMAADQGGNTFYHITEPSPGGRFGSTGLSRSTEAIPRPNGRDFIRWPSCRTF